MHQFTSAMPLLLGLATFEPMSSAPKNSQTDAMTTACLTVRAFEPTDVAKQLATSLAPIP